MTHQQVTEHFALDECKCPCCDRIRIVPGFFRHMNLLEEMRQEVGHALIINSGYRCPEYNTKVGGAQRSWHLLYATDIRPPIGAELTSRLKLMYRIALAQNWGGIGYYNTFLHLDTRPEVSRWRD